MRDVATEATDRTRPWIDDDEHMPALYLGHGPSPLVDDRLWTSELAKWGKDLPRPRSILIVSAHWELGPADARSHDGRSAVRVVEGLRFMGSEAPQRAADEFRSRAPGMPFAHPTVEHFASLFVPLDAATDPEHAGSARARPLDGVSRYPPISPAGRSRWTSG
jgi:hypothetical protein